MNNSDALRELPFSNRSRKAEYWGLQIEEAAGHKVTPERTHIITPRIPDPDIHLLMSGESWSYELVGEVTTAGLEFPASLFRLRKGEQFEARFLYKGVSSNKVALSL
ncbi:hypothetical protein [Hymenobacter terrenus]|uniref:hypothetical protein n=1 Tax=Hymenobacter terrenus TaxID=1629124 RepID=UPI001E5BECBE|nr:hypothetical protein [Hymenobacter terrenus]